MTKTLSFLKLEVKVGQLQFFSFLRQRFSCVVGVTPLRLQSQSALDSALQQVVTSYHTTLPTADIKVPSPTTLPSLSPRKNVTRTVQSNKSPIFTTSRLQVATLI